ncbi:MAG: glycosyl transferase, partial [Clostridia bacterium]|nr:glycosyl transferase [Clostridia bacterium]
ALFIPILLTYIRTGLVPRFPTLIVSGVILIIGILFWMCGILLDAQLKKHRMLYELIMIER